MLRNAMRSVGACVLCALLLCGTAGASQPEGDDSFFGQASTVAATQPPVAQTEGMPASTAQPTLAPTAQPAHALPPPPSPTISILSPASDEGIGPGNVLTVEVAYADAARVEIEASWDGGNQKAELSDGGTTATLNLPPVPGNVTVTARAFSSPGDDGQVSSAEAETVLMAPREVLINAMIALAHDNFGDRRYNFAPAQTDTDIGVCKNFVMRMFDENKEPYEMLAYPGLALRMPKNNWKKDVAPYAYGIEWAPDTADSGNPFDVAAMFRYNPDLSKEENQELAREFLIQAKRGDCYQMVGNYVDGNGPHSLLLIQDYDPSEDMLHWTDSNMKGTRKNGVRWGWIQWDRDESIDWMIKAICRKNCGATLYRLREDIVFK